MSRSELRELPPLVRFPVLAAGMAAYVGLATLGLGGFAPFFSTPALTALLAVTVAFFTAAYFAGGNASSGEREDRSNRWVIPAFGLISIALAYAPPYCDRANIWTVDGDAARWIGVVLFALGGALRLWPVFVLGHRFSELVAIQTGHRLVTTGVYRVVRHPSYLGLLVSSMGWALAFRSGVGLLLAALLLAPIVARIRAEERLLSQAFGAEYDAYRARTRSKLLPGFY